MALLDLAARWGQARGRPILALGVDHRLHPDSARWTAFAARAARAAGVDWRPLAWTGDKPATGLPAAARAARHRLIADAARAAGARVVLFAHTADDAAETDWMRAGGAAIGRLRPWSPSPAWPEGRGLMLLRPLLDIDRAALRALLRARGLDWLEDPANADPRFARARARAALADGAPPPPPETVAAPPDCEGLQADWTGAVRLPRGAPGAVLAAALLGAAGGHVPPRGARLAALQARLARGGPVRATLAGARVVAGPDGARLSREPGRTGLPDLALRADAPMVWDGRFELVAPGPGWRVAPVAGRAAALEAADRRLLGTLPAEVRPGLPVLIRDSAPRPVLAWRAAPVRALAPGRLAAALGRVAREADLDVPPDGETPPSALF